MTKEELIKKAIYVQLPAFDDSYRSYSVGAETVKLRLPEQDELYRTWSLNNHHFTTAYHRSETLPVLAKLLNFPYSEDDFTLIEKHYESYDISYQTPKMDMTFDVYGFNKNEHLENAKFEDLVTNNSTSSDITAYHKLYRYPHENSRIINKTVQNGKRLFISGDSQMIPVVPVLACYFNELWYLDNRCGLYMMEKWKDVNFTDVLVMLHNGSQQSYMEANFQ